MRKATSKSNKTAKATTDLKPFMCYVSVEELEQIEAVAKADLRSRSAAGRMLIVQGLSQHKARQN